MARRFTIFFATDIHGSEMCFKKFLNAGKFYGAQVILMGGDLTGKMIVPIVREAGGVHRCTYKDQAYTLESGAEIERLSKIVRTCGHYPYVIGKEEYLELQREEGMERKFIEVMRASLSGWMQLAEERLKGTGVRCLVVPGNDDFADVDDVLGGSSVVENPEGKVTELDGIHELVATGYSNPTPWNTEREVAEDVLDEKIGSLFRMLKNPSLAVASLHAPPFDSGLDSAPELRDFKVKTSGGQPVFVPVGSRAVRTAIERYQPAVGLHGHIHESRGLTRIGKTVCLNPGSDYTEGVLNGAIVTFEGERLVTHQLVSG